MVPPSARFPTRRAALAEEAARRVMADDEAARAEARLYGQD